MKISIKNVGKDGSDIVISTTDDVDVEKIIENHGFDPNTVDYE